MNFEQTAEFAFTLNEKISKLMESNGLLIERNKYDIYLPQSMLNDIIKLQENVGKRIKQLEAYTDERTESNAVPLDVIYSNLQKENVKFVFLLQEAEKLRLQTIEEIQNRKEAVLQQLDLAHQKSSQLKYEPASNKALQTKKKLNESINLKNRPKISSAAEINKAIQLIEKAENEVGTLFKEIDFFANKMEQAQNKVDNSSKHIDFFANLREEMQREIPSHVFIRDGNKIKIPYDELSSNLKEVLGDCGNFNDLYQKDRQKSSNHWTRFWKKHTSGRKSHRDTAKNVSRALNDFLMDSNMFTLFALQGAIEKGRKDIAELKQDSFFKAPLKSGSYKLGESSLEKLLNKVDKIVAPEVNPSPELENSQTLNSK